MSILFLKKNYKESMEKVKSRSIFSQNLLKFRKERSISQQELAKLTGISQRMIVYYENDCKAPPLNKAKIIADVLNVPIQELLGTTELRQDFINKIDTKTLKKIKQILNLEPQDRALLYKMLHVLTENRKIKRKLQES